jgi:hypothetical protein
VQPITVTFEMTDEVAIRAARESLRSFGRRLFGWGATALIVADALVLLLAVVRDGHWLWLVGAGTPLALFAVLLVGWFGMYSWLPRAVTRRLAHLPHRTVTVEFSDATVAFSTATEQLSVAWSELKEVRRLRGFWLLCLRSGAQIPLPGAALPPAALSLLESRAMQHRG